MKPLEAGGVWDVLQRGGSARLDEGNSPRFEVGDSVIARNLNPLGHIRLPRYVRGRMGTIAKDQGEFIFPDEHAEGVKKAERLYNVRFEAAELWGNSSPDAVFVDMFETYLDPA